MNIKLDDKQRDLVSKNHNLIYWFANKNNISVDNYYGILSIGLCKAAYSFDKSKGSFSTFSYHCMQNELNTYWRSLQNKSAIPDDVVVYYDSSIEQDNSESKTFLEKIPDNNIHESMLYDIMSDEFISSLTDKEKTIATSLICGLTHDEIANKFECRRQNVTYHVKKIKEKAFNYLYN